MWWRVTANDPVKLWPALALFVVTVPACGGSNVPAAPTAPSPTPAVVTAPATDLTITGPALVPTGSSVKYDATAVLSIGVTIYHVSGTWTTDNGTVATIDSNGILTGQGPGVATVTITYRNLSATVTVRVSDFASRPSSATANLAISFLPDPVPGSLTPLRGPLCMGAVPSWNFTEVFNETHGVGFTVKAEVVNLFREDGLLLRTSTIPEEYYFPPNSEFVEDVCTDLEESTSGFFEDVVHGIDDRGTELTFRRRVRLLPVAGATTTSSRISPGPIAPRRVTRALRRVR